MDAIKFLLVEHRKIKKMFSQLLKGRQDTAKRKKFTGLSRFLVHHEKMEEKVWYPFLKKNTKLTPIIKHLISAEKTAAKEIKKIKKIKSQETWEAKCTSLRKDVLKHAGEEEKKLFPRVKKVIDKKELAMIGSKMQKVKKKLDKPAR